MKANRPAQKKDRHRTNRLVRLSEEQYQAIRKLAEENDRPLTREVARAIEAHLRGDAEGRTA